jgi:hypothetical protein
MSATYTKAENVERAVQRLEASSRWMIENGIREVLTDPDYKSNVLNTLIDKFGVTPFSDPGLANEDELARFIIKSYTIHYDINLIQRVRHNDSIYEYWVTATSSQSLKAPLYASARQFFVTKTDNLKGTRKIIKESDQFFHEFSVDNNGVLSIDAENNMEIRETLGAWVAPQHYKNYPQLTRDEVILDAKGNYSLAPK